MYFMGGEDLLRGTLGESIVTVVVHKIFGECCSDIRTHGKTYSVQVL